MQKKSLIYVIITILFLLQTSVLAEEIGLGRVQKKSVKYTSIPKVMKTNLVIDNRESLDNLIKLQQEDELKDIELLWRATVDKNDLIKFTMKKLNTPESQRRLHSSLMAKSVSALVYGASFLPTFSGADPLIQSASFTTGRLANNFINKENAKEAPPLSDTELIELAGTIESLQDEIISAYYNYKGTLNKLKDTRSRLILYNNNYSNAIKNKDNLEITIQSSLYDDMIMQEFKQEQTAKKYYLELDRLAGKEAVDKLILSQYAYKNQLVNPQKIRESE